MVSVVQRVGKWCQTCRECGEGVVSSAEGGVRSARRLTHGRVGKRSQWFQVLEVRLQSDSNLVKWRVHDRWCECDLMVESQSRALLAGGSAPVVVS